MWKELKKILEKMNPNCKICDEEEYIKILNKITTNELKVPHLCLPDITKEWEEEFETKLVAIGDWDITGLGIRGIDVAKYLDKYFPCTSKSLRPIPIKVKIKKGKIVIERIEEN